MSTIKKLVTLAGRLVVVLSFLCGFTLGVIFGETVINNCAQPTALTYYLAGVSH